MRSLFRKINKSESYGNMPPDTEELDDIQRTYDDLVAEVQDFNPIPPIRKNKSDIPGVTTDITEDEHIEIDLETFQTKTRKEKKRRPKDRAAASRAASSITASDLPQNPRRWGRRARIAFALFVIVGVALAIILIWVFAFSRKKGSTGDGGLVYGPPTFAPTPNWAAANHLIGILVDYTPIEVLLDLNSPQGSAFEALLAREESLSTKTPEFQVLQRYSLLVLYAATGPWSVAWDVMEPTECNWDGVEGCSLREDDGVMQVESLGLGKSSTMCWINLYSELLCLKVTYSHISVLAFSPLQRCHSILWLNGYHSNGTLSLGRFLGQLESLQQSNWWYHSGMYCPLHKPSYARYITQFHWRSTPTLGIFSPLADC